MPLTTDTVISEILEHARSAQRSGDLAQAADMCKYALSEIPEHPGILHQLGCIRLKQGRINDGVMLLNRAVRKSPHDAVILNNLGAALRHSGRYREAMVILERAVALEPGYARAHHILGKCYRQMADPARAEACQLQALSLQPDYFAAHAELAAIRLPGPEYLRVLKHLHEWLKPANYVEVGVDTGRSLALIQPNTRAVGIDPRPQLSVELPEQATVFEMTSDDFFTGYELSRQLLQSAVNLAFIDGLHRFGQVLRDFIEIEKHAAPDGVVILHDVLPLDELTSLPERQTVFWSGDSWKIVPCLLAERPDLDLFVIPAAPTGLAVVRNLDPSSGILRHRTAELENRYRILTYADFERVRQQVEMVSNDWPAIRSRLSQ